jgi:surfeit locus 1 family protein
MANTALRRRIAPTLAAFLVMAVTLRLGFWQLDRAQQRDAQEAKLNAVRSAAPLLLGSERIDGKIFEFHPAQVHGEWVRDKLVFLDNQVYQGQAGFEILMPLHVTGTSVNVLVNRGWIRGTGDRSRLPNIVTPDGVQSITGVIRERTPRVGSVGIAARNGNVWSEVTPVAFAEVMGMSVQPLVLYQTGGMQDGLIRDWPHPGSGADRNRGYALQWFAFAVMTLFFWGYYFFFRSTEDNDKDA